MEDYDIGSRIWHADHGLGTVGWVGAEYVGIHFDQHGRALIKRVATEMRLATAADEQHVLRADAEKEIVEPAIPAEPFFVHEIGEGAHSMGSHWQPFFDDPQTVLLKLPEIIKAADMHRGYSQFFQPPAPASEDWSRGAVLLASSEALVATMEFTNTPHRWDNQTPWRSPGGALDETPERAQNASARDSGMAIVFRLASTAGEANMFCSLFPYCFHGIEQSVVLDRVHVWENGLEAQVECHLGSASLTFYDIDFINNRDWYARNCTYAFVLTGLAYEAKPAQAHTFSVTRSPDWRDGMVWLSGDDLALPKDTDESMETYSTEGMCMLLPVDDWDVDDYAFQGSINDLWSMSMLGQRAWRARVTVVRD
ncbi:MAG TPA: hypothetical protein VFL78_01130, partial [Rhodanobacteraceae bacterium]|nr:hypothetical protein [Rhodanobacteraceae bacterium]